MISDTQPLRRTPQSQAPKAPGAHARMQAQSPESQLFCARRLVFSLIAGIVIGLCIVLGPEFDASGTLSGSSLLPLKAVAVIIILTAVFYFAQTAFDKKQSGTSKPAAPYVKTVCRVCCVVLFAAWVFWYLVLFPGVHGYDSPYWLAEWTGSGGDSTPLDAHWSIPYSWIYFAVLSLGKSIGGTYEIGLGLFTGIQGLIIFYAGARMILFIGARSSKAWPVIIATCFLAFEPTHMMIIFSTAQDAPFMATFALIAMNMMRMGEDEKGFWQCWRNPVGLAIDVLVFCLVRNNGIVVAIIIILVYLIRHRPKTLRTIALFALPLIMTMAITGPVEDIMGVKKGSTLQEMMSIPTQQLARAYTSEACLDSEEAALLEEYIPSKYLVDYLDTPSISDTRKANLDTQRLQSNPLEFATLYLKVGLEHPDVYFEAFCMNTLGIWCPAKSYPDTRMYHPYIESDCTYPNKYATYYIDIQSQSFFPKVDAVLQDLFNWPTQHFCESPVLSLLCSSYLYFYIFIVVMCSALYRRQKRWYPTLALFAGLYITVFLGPVLLCRYIIPVIFCAPLMILMLSKPGDAAEKHTRDLRQTSRQANDLPFASQHAQQPQNHTCN